MSSLLDIIRNTQLCSLLCSDEHMHRLARLYNEIITFESNSFVFFLSRVLVFLV
jgi:hypothetical protein